MKLLYKKKNRAQRFLKGSLWYVRGEIKRYIISFEKKIVHFEPYC